MQSIDPDILDILVSAFAAGASGHRAKVEVDVPADPTPATLIQSKTGANNAVTTFNLDSPVTIGNVLVARLFRRNSDTVPAMASGQGWTLLASGRATSDAASAPRGAVAIYAKIATSTTGTIARDVAGQVVMTGYELSNTDLSHVEVVSADHQSGGDSTSHTFDMGTIDVSFGVAIIAIAIPRGNDQTGNGWVMTPHDSNWSVEFSMDADGGGLGGTTDPWCWAARAEDLSAIDTAVDGVGTGTLPFQQDSHEWCGAAVAFSTTAAPASTTSLQVKTLSIDKSRRLAASEAQITATNEDGAIEVSPDAPIQANCPVRVYEKYGDANDWVLTMRGLVDVVHEQRDPREISFSARDMMKRLIVQNFTATDPQGATEDGAVRTAANGVYLEMEVSDIVSDILDRAGWPSDERDITPTSFLLDEYILEDGASWAESIIGDVKLTGLTGYEAGAHEDGTFYFRPIVGNQAADADTDAVPVYSYVTGADASDELVSGNIIHLDHEIDDYELRTRVKARGNLATAVPAWKENWHTNSFPRPVGLWYDSTDANHIKVLDRSTKKIYRWKTSSPRGRDPSGIWPLYIGGDVTYPLGLSGDPSNTNFWVLEAAWRVTGSANLNASIHKYNSSGTHLAEYSLPDGEWTDLKVSANYLILTNKSTDKTHLRSKADGSSVSSHTTTYNSNAQNNPTGVFVDGTTLGLFFLGHARCLLVDESDPTTIDTTNALGITSGKISTAGSNIYGGEMNTTTHATLWTCMDDLGLVTQYALTTPSTDEVWDEVVDFDLEDELGVFSAAENREHVGCPNNASPHQFEIRRYTLTLEKTITNLSQATEAASRKLAELGHRREVVDYGIVGNPALQRGDLLQITDSVTGIDALYILDTYHDQMDSDSYVGTIAVVPYDPVY